MAKFEALLEINPKNVQSLAEYIAYCKYYFKPKSEDKIKNYSDFYSLKNDFPFIRQDIRKNSTYKSNETLKDFPLNWLKNEIIGKEKKYVEFDNKDIQIIQKISGIYEESQLNNLQEYVNKLPKYSFAIWFKFQLEAPYFSKDDDEFYIIQNPILKETNFKVPMVRGSGWKGALASAFRELFREDFQNNKEKIESFLRVFGAGSESIKTIESYVFGKSGDLNKAKDSLLKFMLFELGLKIDSNLIKEVKGKNNKEELFQILRDKLSAKTSDSKLPSEFQTHKGRAIFYPTYFDRLSLEIINPHDRRKRAGTNPIHYEVVPKGTEGIFQLIYIPFDGVLKPDEELKAEAEKDLNNLSVAVAILSKQGIGAKIKLGWGKFKIENKKVFLNEELDIPEEWKKCQD
ncbi:RAMP superfamily CRISPR-associated protein [Sulfurihydrogenibium subterraneum]|uniref:RAMP superfamily CRISPR-associated protein n=1 Tax=Sulfurihydrogenibium subterraneum TaxID=171121 RepID=UPI00048C0D22|nr:RAMP superfamily CRISPR-associated protein [Sulfurihydrogenibium subterraneum]